MRHLAALDELNRLQLYALSRISLVVWWKISASHETIYSLIFLFLPLFFRPEVTELSFNISTNYLLISTE